MSKSTLKVCTFEIVTTIWQSIIDFFLRMQSQKSPVDSELCKDKLVDSPPDDHNHDSDCFLFLFFVTNRFCQI